MTSLQQASAQIDGLTSATRRSFSPRRSAPCIMWPFTCPTRPCPSLRQIRFSGRGRKSKDPSGTPVFLAAHRRPASVEKAEGQRAAFHLVPVLGNLGSNILHVPLCDDAFVRSGGQGEGALLNPGPVRKLCVALNLSGCVDLCIWRGSALLCL